MASLPYMQFVIPDYQADTGHLSTEQHGAYIMLLFNYWQTGKPLRNNSERLANVCGLSVERFEEHRPILEEFFEVTDEVWIHHRVEDDLEQVLSKSAKARASALTGAQRRRDRRLANAQRTQCYVYTDTDTDTDTETEANAGEKPEHTSNSKFLDTDLELAETIFNRILIAAPKTKPPNLNTWANTIRLMRERDGNSLEEIERVFIFANNSDFWKPNILSVSKLREKFPTLHAQMLNNHAKQKPAEPQIREAAL